MFTSQVMITICMVALACLSLAHPGEHHHADKAKRAMQQSEIASRNADKVAAKCPSTPQARAMRERAITRRARKAAQLREKRSVEESRMIARRDQAALDDYMRICHDQGARVDYDKTTPISTIFGSNVTAGLAPETIVGPYFVTGELIRTDIAEDQGGIPIHIDLQFVDVETCSPVPNLLIDLWHANSTGLYSGVTDELAGAGVNTTFLRGVQITDLDGVAQFDSTFPGHYMGRTNHIHVMSNRGGTLLDNGTYVGGKYNHVGQLYFDQELINMVEMMPPYHSNAMKLMPNSQDFLAAQQASSEYDPFFDYVLLSEDPLDGVLMWMTLGINTSADYNVTAGGHYYKDGGVNAGPGFNISMPPGGFPTGFPMPTDLPGFPTAPAGPAPTSLFWGPCMKKREAEEEN